MSMRAAFSFLPRQLRARPLACFAVAFLLGLLAAARLAVPPWATGVALLSASALGIALRSRRAAAGALLLIVGLLAGMLRMSLAMEAAHIEPTRYSAVMTGHVASDPFIKQDTGRLIFRFDVLDVDGEASELSLRLYVRSDDRAALERISFGHQLKLTGHIWQPDPVTNAHEFDFGAWLVRNGFNGYATAKLEDVEVIGQTRNLQSAIIAVRRAVGARIDALFPRCAGLMRALVLGDRSQLSDELRESMSLSGTAHLISISGLHVTVLAALLAYALSRVMARRWANVIAAVLLIPYGAMIGFTASFTRALVMFALLCFAPIVGCPSDSVTRLCAAMLLWLLVKPLSVGDAGFVLSYTASAGIMLLMPPLNRLMGLEALQRRKPSPKRSVRLLRRLALYVPSLLSASLAAQLATLPAVIAFFGVQSVVSLPFNLVCVPLCMLGYIIGLAGLLLSPVFIPAAALVAGIADRLFLALINVTRYSARLPATSVRVGRYPVALILVHCAITLAASDLSRLREGLRRFLPFALVLVAATSSLLILARTWSYSVVFLDAGQADCAVVRTRGHTYMMDIGDTYTPAADYLNATCLHLDGVLLTHPHQDHAGGLKSVLTSFRPDVILVPKGWFEVEEVSPAVTEGIEMAKSMGVEIREMSAGDAMDLSATAKLEIFAPTGDTLPAEVNDMSLLALVTCEGQRAMFTGDLSENAEPDSVPDTDILKVAHHGSAKASSERFLQACTPEIAVICVGENNYGHPSEETLEKLERVGAQVYLTRDSGTVSLTWRGGKWHVKTYLEAKKHDLE